LVPSLPPLQVINYFLHELARRTTQQPPRRIIANPASPLPDPRTPGGGGSSNNSVGSWRAAALAREAVPSEQQQAISKAAPCSEKSWMPLLPSALTGLSILVDIVANCRHLAKFESGTYEQQRDAVDLHDLVSSCLAMSARGSDPARLQFKMCCPPGLTIISDRRLWQTTLMNLIGNAVKYTMGERPALLSAEDVALIEVEVERAAGRRHAVHVVVKDTGPCIDARDQQLIMGKVPQFSRGFKTQGLGSGLGLHLSAQVSERCCYSGAHDTRGTHGASAFLFCARLFHNRTLLLCSPRLPPHSSATAPRTPPHSVDHPEAAGSPGGDQPAAQRARFELLLHVALYVRGEGGATRGGRSSAGCACYA
jgi:signal transduction histidine kinase